MTDKAVAPVRVLVVDDQQIIREGISTILSFQSGITVLGTAANGQEAVERAVQLEPEVVLMDVRMPLMDGVEATRQLRSRLSACRVLMLTTFDDDEYIIEALRAGASGYLLKDIPGQELAQAIRSVHSGLYQLDPTVASRVIANLGNPRVSSTATDNHLASPKPAVAPVRKVELTERELEILRLIARGATNREIASHLVITEGTVKNHISNIFNRLGLRDRTQAAIYARENGLL
jgi:DNA-binding NarL/FixJ family response regulator